MAINNLGITEIEEKQIDALSVGASPEDVANVSKQPMSDIPEYVPSAGYLEEESSEWGYDDPGDTQVPMTKNSAAKKSMYAALANNNDVGQDYYKMYNQYLSSGESPTHEAIQSELGQRARQDYIRTIEETAAQGDVDGAEALLEASPALLKERANTKLVALENAAEKLTEAHKYDKRSREYTDNFLNGLEDYSKVRDRLVQIINSAKADTDSFDMWQYAQDWTEIGFVGEQFFQLSGIGKDIFGKHYRVAGGTLMRDLAQRVNALPIDEQPAEVEKIVDSFIKNSGNIQRLPLTADEEARNEFLKFYALESFQHFLETPGGDDPFQRWMLDFFGVVEAMPLLGSLVLLRRFLGKVTDFKGRVPNEMKYPTWEHEMIEANPEFMALLKSEAIKDPAAAEALGTTQKAEVAKALPGYSTIEDDYVLDGAPSSVVDKIKGLKTKEQELHDYLENTFMYHDNAYKAKIQRIWEVLNSENIAAYAKPSKSSFIERDENSNSILTNYIYGDSSDLDLTLGKAKRLAQSIRQGLSDSGVKGDPTIYVKDRNTGTYEAYDPKIHNKGNETFMVSVRMKTPMLHSDIIPGTILGEGYTKGVGKYGRWMIPPENYIDQTLLGAARVANDSKFFFEKNLTDMAKPFLKLSFQGKRKVANLLEEGENYQDPITKQVVGKVFTYKELQKGGYTAKEAEAYLSARLFNDAVYRIKERDLYNTLQNEGVEGLTVGNAAGGIPFENGVKRVNLAEVMKNANSIFDPVTGKPVAATEKSLQPLLDKGLVLVKLLKKVPTSAGQFSYAIVPGNTIHSLPNRVLPYKKGYNFRVNNDPYFIDRRYTTLVNGKKEEVTETIGVARSKAEADQYVKELSVGDGSTYTTRVDRNINSSKTILENDIDALDGSGLQFWFSKRGDRLRRRDKSLSSVEDPIAAMQKLTSTVANVATHKEVVETAVIYHQRTYGNIKVNGQKLWRYNSDTKAMEFQKAIAKDVGRPEVKAAMREYEFIENLKYAPTDVDILWKDTLEEFDAIMANQTSSFDKAKGVSELSGKVMAELSTGTPGQVVRGASFTLALSLNPTRQLPLQALTGLHLTGIDPVATARAFQEGFMMSMSMASYQNPKAWNTIKQSFGAVGYNPDEWEEIFEAFRRSGKAYSIDSNVMIGEANFAWSRSLPETRVGEVGRIASNTGKFVPRMLKEVGFDAGELFNQMTTWSFARQRWMKENPGKSWKSKRALDEIGSRARGYSIDMTKTGQLPYQRGAFAAMTQFMAINHKMLTKILPTVMGGDPAFKGSKMKARYLLGMLTVFGIAGWGLHEWYDAWKRENDIDIPPQLDDAIYGGIFQVLGNTILDLASGEELGTSRVAFSDSFSPASGQFTFAMDFAENIMDGNVIEALGGPSANLLPQINEAWKFSRDVWGFSDLDTHEKLINSMTIAAQQFGGFSSYFKFNVAMAYQDKLDELHVVGKDGRPTAKANTAGEVYAKLLLGVTTRGEEELFNTWVPKLRDYQSTGKQFEADVDADADHLVKWFYRTWAESKDEWDFAEKAQSITWSLHGGNRVYGKKVYDAALARMKQHPQYADFMQFVTEKWVELDPEVSEQQLKNLINNSEMIEDDEKDHIIYGIEQMIKGKELSEEMLRSLD